jgi:3-dehydrosphinganine reductase
LYCVAGGNHAENGFLADIGARQLENCMRNNYYSAAFAAKSVLDIWIADDNRRGLSNQAELKRRQIVFINSAAAFVALPGSIAYTRE